MRKIEMKICRECKTMYRWENGGIVKTPQDHMDMGLCEKCRTKLKLKTLGKILGGGKKVRKERPITCLFISWEKLRSM